MATTYTPIASTTLGSAQATVTFSSIPSTYTDLVLIISGTMSGSGNTVYARLNSDTATNYSMTYINGNGTSATSGRGTNNSDGIALGGFRLGYSTGTWNIVASIQNYANTTTYKTAISRWNDASSTVESIVSLWRKTPEAINSIEIRNNGGHNFNTGSTFTLYGIASA